LNQNSSNLLLPSYNNPEQSSISNEQHVFANM